MNEREIEELARAVAERLHGSRVLPFRGGGGPWVTQDAGWRSPAQGRDEGRGTGAAGRVAAMPAAAAPSSPVPRLSSPARVADYIDHTLLKAEATRAEIDRLCAEAKEHRFAAVCVNAAWVARCAGLLHGTGVKVATVAGFPLGAMTSAAKAFEARQAIGDGADEIDMVAAIGHIHDQDWDYVEDDIRAVVEAAAGRTVKVILETATLEPLTIVKAAAIAKEAGAQFVKTSTGFHQAGGATPEAVALLRLAVGDALGVKAAGGVRDCAAALKMIAAGATRLGTSGGVKLVDCLGAGPLPLGDLLGAAQTHEAHCRTGECGTY